MSDVSMREVDTPPKGSPSPRSGSSRASERLAKLSLDPDAPIPSIEHDADEAIKQLQARLSKLPFYNNFPDKHRGIRFPNPCDVRNRVNFDREESADLSRDPFQTRILINGLQISQAWPMEHKPRPPYFDDERFGLDEKVEEMISDYFPGICPYPELRQPPGSNNFYGAHYGYLMMDLFDIKGLLAAGEEFYSDHVLAAIR